MTALKMMIGGQTVYLKRVARVAGVALRSRGNKRDTIAHLMKSFKKA